MRRIRELRTLGPAILSPTTARIGETCHVIDSMRVVELTAVLSPDTVMWPGTPPPQATVLEDIARDGSYGRLVSVAEHSGTHFDAPCHYVEGARSVDEIPVDQLVRPLVVLDISQRAAADRDTVLTVSDIDRHEQAYGRIAAGSAVFLRTGWDTRRHDGTSYRGTEDVLHFPGFGVDAARLLVLDRQVVGLGIDTLSIDPGLDADFTVHRDVSLPHGVWQVENAINLHLLPATGAWVIVGVPRVAGASGFPARVIALVP